MGHVHGVLVEHVEDLRGVASFTCFSGEGVPVKDLEAFKDQTKTKITTWGKNKGALLSGQRVDQAAEANKLIEKAKCLDKVAGALDAYQESYDVVRANVFLAARPRRRTWRCLYLGSVRCRSSTP